MPRPRTATEPGPPTSFMSYKLFIPGPIAVSEKTLRAMARPMIGHRSTDFVALYQSIQPDLQSLMGTKDPVYLSTSSAWGVMEGAIRNVVRQLRPLRSATIAINGTQQTFAPVVPDQQQTILDALNHGEVTH